MPALVFEIRRLRNAEIPEVARLWQASRADAMPALEARMGYTAESNLDFFRNVIAQERDVWAAVSADDHPLGFLALEGNSLENLYVDPDQMSRGVGSQLLDFAKSQAPEGLFLYTHQANTKARRFYETRGFEAVEFGTSPEPESEPDVRYRWRPTSASRDGR